MGSLIVVLNAPGSEAGRGGFDRAVSCSSYRGEAQRFQEDGIVVGVQVHHGDASLHVGAERVVAFHGYLTNLDALARRSPQAEIGTDSVAATLAALCSRDPEGVFSELRGEYAVAVYDRNRKAVFFTTSLLGGRPLYYRTAQGVSVVATEPRQVAAALQSSHALSSTGFIERLAFGHSLTERDSTIYRDLYRVFPPRIYEYHLDRRRIEWRRQFWQVPDVADETYSDTDELEQELRELLNASVLDALDELPVGLALSGGLDSTTILAMLTAARDAGTRPMPDVRSYAVCYPGLAIDESEYIAALHAHLGTESENIDATHLLPSGYFEEHAETVDHLMIGGTESNLDVLASHMRDGGRRRFMTGVYLEGWLTNLPTYALDFLAQGRWLDYFRHSMGFNDNDEPDWGRLRWRRTVGNLVAPPGGFLRRHFRTPKPAWLHERHARHYRDAMTVLHEPFKQYGWGRGRVMQSVLAHAGGMSVEVIEQIAARYGLDPRHPLMDQRLVEFGLRVPAHMITLGKRHKELMRRAVGPLLPDKVRERNAKVVHNLAVERDLAALQLVPSSGKWRLIEDGIVEQDALAHYLRHARDHGMLPRQLGILIKAELFWRRHG